MDRRSFLAVATAGAAGIAGCVSSSDGPETSGASSQTKTPSEQAANALEDAEDDLEQAVDLLYDEVESAWSSTGDASLSTAGIETALENATESLDEAEESATEGQQARIDETRAYATYIDQLLDVLVSLGDGANEFSTAYSYEQNNRYEDGATKLEEAASIFEKTGTQLEDARETLDEIDEETLGDVDYAEAQETTEELANLIEGYRRLAAAGVLQDRGLADYYTAGESYNDEYYDNAASKFEEAAQHFGEAEDKYRTAEEEVPQSLKSTFITQTCYAEKYKDGSLYWAEASESAAAGDNEDAREMANEANKILNQNCG